MKPNQGQSFSKKIHGYVSSFLTVEKVKNFAKQSRKLLFHVWIIIFQEFPNFLVVKQITFNVKL